MGSDDNDFRHSLFQSNVKIGSSRLSISLRWELEGHEADMEGLRTATPVLQARLIGGVKAEQVMRSCYVLKPQTPYL